MPKEHIGIDLGVGYAGRIESYFMEDFEERYALVKIHLDNALHILQQLNVLLASQTSVSTISPHVQNIETVISAIRSQLFILAQRNKSAAANGEIGSASLITCVNKCCMLGGKFSGLLADFEESRDRFRDALDEEIRADLENLHPSLDETDIDEAMRKEWKMEAILQKGRPELLHQVDDLRERNNQLSKLNREVAKVHGIFAELSFLTERQQSLINDVQHNVELVKTRVAKADDDSVEARRHQKLARTRIAIIAAITAITAVVALILVVQLSK